MKKNGFTLIELAAVIMILGIIMLIAVPIVLNTIENSKKGAAERSAESYLHTVETTVAWEKTTREIQDGEYTIQEDGSLCLDNDCTGENKIAITMSGNKPSSGTIVIENGQVVDKLSTDASKKTTMTVNEYDINYDAKKNQYVATKQEAKKLCRAATAEEVTTGNVPQGNYAYGDEYICDVGDGIDRIFFILEDGDATTLTKGDFSTTHYQTDNLGTASAGEVSLIMNQNVGSTLKWCSSTYSKTCNGDIVRSNLKTQTSSWTAEEIISIDLPTYAQIYAVNKSERFSQKTWLFDYSRNNIHNVDIHGYWTSTQHASYETGAWAVYENGRLDVGTKGLGGNHGIRPVITIPKTQLG